MYTKKVDELRSSKRAIAEIGLKDWTICLTLQEIQEWKLQGTPDDSDLYSDTATIANWATTRLINHLEETGRAHEISLIKDRVEAHTRTALTALEAEGLVIEAEYGCGRPPEWEFTRAGRDALEVASARYSCANTLAA